MTATSTKPANLSAEDILRIPEDRPERLFSSAANARMEYRALAMLWHPDRNADSRARDVIARLNVLHEAAQKMIEAGLWRGPGEQAFKGADGRTFVMRHLKAEDWDAGQCWLGRGTVAWATREEDAVLHEAALSAIRGFRFADARMEAEMRRQLPASPRGVTLEDGRRLLVVDKPSQGLVPLHLLAARMGGRMPARHVAWSVSRMLNVACWLEWTQVAHNAIGPSTFFVDPETHAGALVGGWHFAVPYGSPMKALPGFAVSRVPPDVIMKKVGHRRSDAWLIRSAALALLGDETGTTLRSAPDIPAPVLDWLTHPPATSAVEDYRSWIEAAEKAWGPRKFVRLDVDPDDVYT